MIVTKKDVLKTVQYGIDFGLEVYYRTETCRVKITTTKGLLDILPENISHRSFVFRKRKSPQIRMRLSGGGYFITSEADAWRFTQQIAKNIDSIV